jgi:hypothetical protein
MKSFAVWIQGAQVADSESRRNSAKDVTTDRIDACTHAPWHLCSFLGFSTKCTKHSPSSVNILVRTVPSVRCVDFCTDDPKGLFAAEGLPMNITASRPVVDTMQPVPRGETQFAEPNTNRFILAREMIIRDSYAS